MNKLFFSAITILSVFAFANESAVRYDLNHPKGVYNQLAKAFPSAVSNELGGLTTSISIDELICFSQSDADGNPEVECSALVDGKSLKSNNKDLFLTLLNTGSLGIWEETEPGITFLDIMVNLECARIEGRNNNPETPVELLYSCTFESDLDHGSVLD